ncbi:hypothetical protein O6H91_21G027000 [Diphasiastrum complanatum]|uniref:Uncharacterized protein n=4 Tax=Diphasiastrum complanatum TaxID=34168 RepID=A0ACC2AIV4_DIPCM|nr:hypothetical protein O6H91_21G027000 [Diphasiastrum complanatum]KAJ7517512.1 hypothetical protein O6H91_21G027000 [Diphasiastrum complanatum]KAJ7517513.1 hypothetical protein O6H91_21G027000 [Diphasiastrum complanatum]KAJ7517514.1 hypothetical protein O6H91_21G027000 [Diphasiastrum complanatum]
MAGGAFSVEKGGKEFRGKFTGYVLLSCILAASGGLMFGYDVGISGGVTSMDDFLGKFFPVVLAKKRRATATESSYCKYDNQGLQAFTSSLYIAGLVATFAASFVTRRFGRKPSMLTAGVFFLVGVVFNAAAMNLAMLIIGRIMLGCGVGFANQAVPLYLSEIAPTRFRGGLNILFQLNVTIGILFANLVNYGTQRIHPWGWRLSLGLAGIPASLLAVGSLLLCETANSLIERGHLERGKAVLKKIRGTDDVDEEFEEMVEVSRIAKEIKHPFRNIIKREHRPQLVIAISLQVFQQFTGINAIMFYAPVLFQTLGFKNDASLYSAVITGAVNVLSTVVSILSVDKFGRRALLLEAGFQMFIPQVLIAILLATGLHGGKQLSHPSAIIVVLMICLFVSGFAWSWGPLGWLIPSEIFPLEIRSAGQSITVCSNLFFTFVIAQSFLSMLCHFKYGIFLFFAGFVVIMTIFVYFLVPETKGIPIEEMVFVWRKHWLWKRFVPASDAKDVILEVAAKHPDPDEDQQFNGIKHQNGLPQSY